MSTSSFFLWFCPFYTFSRLAIVLLVDFKYWIVCVNQINISLQCSTDKYDLNTYYTENKTTQCCLYKTQLEDITKKKVKRNHFKTSTRKKGVTFNKLKIHFVLMYIIIKYVLFVQLLSNVNQCFSTFPDRLYNIYMVPSFEWRDSRMRSSEGGVSNNTHWRARTHWLRPLACIPRPAYTCLTRTVAYLPITFQIPSKGRLVICTFHYGTVL